MNAFKSVFYKWWNWVNYIPPRAEEEVVDVPAPIPKRSDQWSQLHTLALKLQGVSVSPWSVKWFDHRPELYTDSLLELLSRLEMLIECMETEQEAHISWEGRRRETNPISMPDYHYDLRAGYRSPQAVLGVLVEKVLVIHYLMDDKQYTASSSYGIYLRRTFMCIASDVTTLLNIYQTEVLES